jgi:hypothetical protein
MNVAMTKYVFSPFLSSYASDCWEGPNNHTQGGRETTEQKFACHGREISTGRGVADSLKGEKIFVVRHCNMLCCNAVSPVFQYTGTGTGELADKIVCCP